MVISESWGIIKHSSIYKGRLAGASRVSEGDRHLQQEIAKFRGGGKKTNTFHSSLGSLTPGCTPSRKGITGIHNGLKPISASPGKYEHGNHFIMKIFFVLTKESLPDMTLHTKQHMYNVMCLQLTRHI